MPTRPRDLGGSGVGRRLARDRHRWRADSGGWRIQPPRRAACRGAGNRCGVVFRCAGCERRRAGQGARDRRPHQRPGSQRRLLGAGVDPAPARRIAGGVSALRARPRQAGDAGGRQQRPPLRQRSDLLPSVRAGDAGARQVGDPGVSDCGCGGAAEIRSRHGAPRRLGHARRRRRRISDRRRHDRTTGAAIEHRPRQSARDGRQHERLTRKPVAISNSAGAARSTRTTMAMRPPAEPIPISARSRRRRSMRFGFIPPISARRRGWSRTTWPACWIPAIGRSRGLYACGNDMQSIMGGTYPGPGITLGPAVAFAYVAASDAARRSPSIQASRA